MKKNNMKKYLLTFMLFVYFAHVKGQDNKDASILERLVRKTHSALRDVATRPGVPSIFSAQWPERAYLQRGDSLIAIPFDSLRTGWNYLDYDIVIAFDNTDVSAIQLLQGIIILKPVSKERLEKLKSFVLKDKERYEGKRKSQDKTRSTTESK